MRSIENTLGTTGITYSGCLFVALLIQHAKPIRRDILLSVVSMTLPYLSTSFHKQNYFRKINLNVCHLNLKVCHPRCVRSITQSCSVYISIYTYSHDTTILQLVSIYDTQLHVSALYAGHHQVVQRTY